MRYFVIILVALWSACLLGMEEVIGGGEVAYRLHEFDVGMMDGKGRMFSKKISFRVPFYCGDATLLQLPLALRPIVLKCKSAGKVVKLFPLRDFDTARSETLEYELGGNMRDFALAEASLMHVLKGKDVPFLLPEDAYQDQNFAYCIYPLIKQGDLVDFLEANTSEATRMDFIKQLLGMAWVLKKLGIVHRDIKPENLFVQVIQDGKEKRAKLLLGDWEFSTHVSVADDGPVRGTADWCAPELSYFSNTHCGTDFYGFALVMIWLRFPRVKVFHSSDMDQHNAEVLAMDKSFRDNNGTLRPYLEERVLETYRRERQSCALGKRWWEAIRWTRLGYQATKDFKRGGSTLDFMIRLISPLASDRPTLSDAIAHFGVKEPEVPDITLTNLSFEGLFRNVEGFLPRSSFGR